MLDSTTGSVTTTAAPLTPPHDAGDPAWGYSVLVRNAGSVDIKVGGAENQHLTLVPGAAIPFNVLETGEVLYIKTSSGSSTYEALFQGLGS